jgi:hypothetical protein
MPPATDHTRDTPQRFPGDIISLGVWHSRARSRRASLVAVGLSVHAWAVLLPPSVHAMGAAPGTRDAALQPVLTRDTQQAMARVS